MVSTNVTTRSPEGSPSKSSISSYEHSSKQVHLCRDRRRQIITVRCRCQIPVHNCDRDRCRIGCRLVHQCSPVSSEKLCYSSVKSIPHLCVACAILHRLVLGAKNCWCISYASIGAARWNGAQISQVEGDRSPSCCGCNCGDNGLAGCSLFAL